MRNGYNVRAEGLSVMPKRLHNYLQMRGKNRTFLLLGEGDKFISILIDLFVYFKEIGTPSVVSWIPNFLYLLETFHGRVEYYSFLLFVLFHPLDPRGCNGND